VATEGRWRAAVAQQVDSGFGQHVALIAAAVARAQQGL
jgi:hypothetical protein